MFHQLSDLTVVNIIFSLIITLLAYCLFPLLFAKQRKKSIKRGKYLALCVCVNSLVHIVFFIVVLKSQSQTFAACILWTFVFCGIGLKILRKRGILDVDMDSERTLTITNSKDSEAIKDDNNASEKNAIAVTENIPGVQPEIRFCRKCGFELIPDSAFCNKCGTQVKRG